MKINIYLISNEYWGDDFLTTEDHLQDDLEDLFHECDWGEAPEIHETDGVLWYLDEKENRVECGYAYREYEGDFKELLNDSLLSQYERTQRMKVSAYTYNPAFTSILAEEVNWNPEVVFACGCRQDDEELWLGRLTENWNKHPQGSLFLTGHTGLGCKFYIIEEEEEEEDEKEEANRLRSVETKSN